MWTVDCQLVSCTYCACADTSRRELLTRLSRCLRLQNHTRTTSLSSRRLAASRAIWADDGFDWDRKYNSNESFALRPIVVLRFRLLSNVPTVTSQQRMHAICTFIEFEQITNNPLKWPILCRVGRSTLLTHSLIRWLRTSAPFLHCLIHFYEWQWRSFMSHFSVTPYMSRQSILSVNSTGVG